MTLRFEIPDGGSPGYLRREQARLEFLDTYLMLDMTKKVPALVKYLVQFVTEGDAEDLLDASEEQIAELVGAFVTGDAPGEDENGTDPKADDDSESG
jgi:hypothetical protein